MNFYRVALCTCACLWCAWVSADAAALTYRSYHIGNSLTWDGRPSDGLPDLADGIAGVDWETGYHIRSSQPLSYIWDHPDDYTVAGDPTGPFATALPGSAWDRVVLQSHSGSTLLAEQQAVLNMIDLTRTNPANADTVFYLYQGWTNLPHGGSYSAAWLKDVADEDDAASGKRQAYYIHLLDRVRSRTDAEVYLVPVGDVLLALDRKMRDGEVEGYTNIREWYRGNQHLSFSLGRYAASVTTFATMYGESPVGLDVPHAGFLRKDDFTPELVTLIQQTAWDVVTSSDTGVLATVPGLSPAPGGLSPEPGSLSLFALAVPLALRRRARG